METRVIRICSSPSIYPLSAKAYTNIARGKMTEHFYYSLLVPHFMSGLLTYGHFPIMSRQSMRWNLRCAQITWHLLYEWGQSRNISTRRLSDEDCVTTYHLNWGRLPTNEVGNIQRNVMEGGRKGRLKREMGLHGGLYFRTVCKI
jgi:hypothetical protein